MSDNLKRIGPSPSVVRYLEETLDLEKYRKSGKKTDQGSSIGSTDEKMRKIALRIRNNNDAKSRTIDNLFESMANLIYFFEFIDQHPDYVDRFKDDIEDLFGLKANTTDEKKSPFSRLIRSILGRGVGIGFDDSKDSRFLFRRRILSILQYRVNDKLNFYALKSPKVSQDRRFFQLLHAKTEEVDTLAFVTLDTYLNDGKKKPRRII